MVDWIHKWSHVTKRNARPLATTAETVKRARGARWQERNPSSLSSSSCPVGCPVGRTRSLVSLVVAKAPHAAAIPRVHCRRRKARSAPRVFGRVVRQRAISCRSLSFAPPHLSLARVCEPRSALRSSGTIVPRRRFAAARRRDALRAARCRFSPRSASRSFASCSRRRCGRAS